MQEVRIYCDDCSCYIVNASDLYCYYYYCPLRIHYGYDGELIRMLSDHRATCLSIVVS